MHLTVLVPTANRPSFLPSTLKSIANQTAKRHIKRVIVSENGGYHGSEKIAYNFKNELPIEWIYQQESLTPQQHGIWLANQVTTPFVALIADDDMWDKYHLEESLLQLAHHQDSIAYFGQTVLVTDDSCWPMGVFTPPFGSVVAQNQNRYQTHLKDVEVWNPRDTALNSLSSTPLNIWSVVAKTPAHCKAIAESAGHPTLGKCPSNDSLYIWRLSVQGDILVGRHISLFYRTHSESDIKSCMRERPSQTNEEDLMIRKEICYQALSLGIDALDDWRMAYKTLPGVIRQQIPTFSRLNLDWLIESEPIESELIDSKISHWYAEYIYKYLKLSTRLILPPFIWIGLLKCIKLFSMLKHNMRRTDAKAI